MSLKENISAAINSDINAQISSDAATNISEEVNSHISLKTLSLQESGEIVTVNNVTYSTVHDNISMYNNFVADDYYASKSWVLSKNYLTKEDIGDIDITNNIEELLNNKADKNHNHNDLYYTKDVTDATNNLLKEELTNKIPTKTSQLVNDSNYTTATQLNKVTELIPNTATVDNQLADKNFVNSSISTATAEFRGTVENLEDLNNLTADINDYAFYKHKDENGNTVFDRYKFTDQWEYEYTLNNSSFTAEQWATINSGITKNSIPTTTSELINDSNFATTSAIPTKTSDLTNDSNFAIISEIPTKTSELINDSNYTTSEDIQTAINNIPSAGFEDILEGVVGRTKVEWNSLNAGEYGSNSTYNGATLPPVMLEGTTAFWNSGSGKPLDISFHFTKKEKMTSLQVKCPPYGGNSTTMTIYYAQEGDTELTLYKEIATISIIERKSYDFNEEGISADYWVIRFTTSGWIDLRLCKPGSSFTPGLYSEVFHEQLMDKMNGYQPVGNYALKSEIPTVPTKTSQLINDSSYITSTDLNKVTELIPNTATTENKLVDKNFVNSSISTATATFKGTFDNLTELQQTSADLNDYAYFKHTDDNHNIVYSRYKYSDGVWNFEYDLNTTGFTAEQWATINSGITANSIPTNYVDLSSDQTIDGTKIFTVVPKLSRSAYVNANVVLPNEYQLVEYIQSSGTEYIDTNSRIIANTRFTCTWGSVFNNGTFTSASGENKGYGQGNPSGSNPNIAGGGRLQNGVVTFWFSGSNYSTSLSASASTSIYADIITTSENTLKFSMTDIISSTVFINNTLTNFTIYPVNNMFLFRDSSGQYPFYSAKKIYDVKFETRASSSEEFTVVKHLIPCYRKLDHVCGFYDIIGNEFYTNKGTGVLLAGPDVIDGKLLYDLGFNSNMVLSELRSITGYNSSKTQVLKNVNGIFKWVDE